MEANSNSKESEYEDEVVVVGTSTVVDDNAEESTSTLSGLQRGEEQLKNVKNVINNVSHKMKSKHALWAVIFLKLLDKIKFILYLNFNQINKSHNLNEL